MRPRSCTVRLLHASPAPSLMPLPLRFMFDWDKHLTCLQTEHRPSPSSGPSHRPFPGPETLFPPPHLANSYLSNGSLPRKILPTHPAPIPAFCQVYHTHDFLVMELGVTLHYWFKICSCLCPFYFSEMHAIWGCEICSPIHCCLLSS